MEIEELEPEIYSSIFQEVSHKFNSVKFNLLNINKCERLYFLIFKDSKYRLGIILGVKENYLISPFSATYGGFEAVKNEIKLSQIDDALILIKKWIISKKYIGLRVIQAPCFYNPLLHAKLSNCFFRSGFKILNSELNYHFELSNFNEKYSEFIWPNARKNLNKSFTFSLVFEKIDSNQGQLAYDIIAQNRKERGFPLRMSFCQLYDTQNIIPIDYFLVKSENQLVAAAIVYRLSEKISRVVYWGDLPEYSHFKTMNFLAFNIFKYYKGEGYDFIDIGHSTVDSVPNHGLCEFKEGIGCSISVLNEYVLLNKYVRN
ncbi:MAG: hypothetical protein RL638_218 [Bacteroidota bacterium]|jgi:hypothetical protein